MTNKEYIDFQVAPYALPKVCEALYRNGVKDFCVTQEDGELHIRWEYDINRYNPRHVIHKCGVEGCAANEQNNQKSKKI